MLESRKLSNRETSNVAKNTHAVVESERILLVLENASGGPSQCDILRMFKQLAMYRNWFTGLMAAAVLLCSQPWVQAEESLPVGSNPAPIAIPHFPSRMHAFLWRNWRLVETDRLALVLNTTEQNIAAVADSMGLPVAGVVTSTMREKGYITLVRRNWHLLPYDQLLTLLDIDQQTLAFRLLEDDFLFIKLGRLKPKCATLVYHEPTVDQRQQAARIKRIVRSQFGDQIAAAPGEEPFAFIQRLSRLPEGWGQVEPNSDAAQPVASDSQPASDSQHDTQLRFIYSYFGSYGDPLSNRDADPYPDGLLARLSEVGVNGVWLHIVLRNMAPGGDDFPEFGQGHERRLENLQELCQRARKFGIGVYLYVNEPRAMEPAFFEHRPQMAGVSQGGLTTMCTSDDRVREWVGNSLTHVFQSVPELAGVFTITASENLTNCWSKGHGNDCPRCKNRSDDDVIAEINRVIEQGVHKGNPRARVIAWDWGWHGHGDAVSIIDKLPRDVAVMSVSEWAKPIVRGGVETKVGEYSLSAVGPGPRAIRHWQAAKRNGQQAIAKVQFNTTWELSAVPYLPVLNLVAQHCKALQQQDVDGQMLSWTVGGYPSPNLQVAHRIATQPETPTDVVLGEIATELYGNASARHLTDAWKEFSRALQEFPLHGSVLYRAPQQMGPANLLHWKPTGYQSTMVCLPYDDLKGWRAVYPEAVFVNQFERVADGWEQGLANLRQGLAAADADKIEQATADFRVAEAAGIHFRSVANQSQFIRVRNAASKTGPAYSSDQQEELRQLLDSEIDLAKRLWRIASDDSRIGFEASNHYYYVPLDLVEKVICCEYIKQQLAGIVR